jgi:predicted nuclease with TOPRIM domain
MTEKFIAALATLSTVREAVGSGRGVAAYENDLYRKSMIEPYGWLTGDSSSHRQGNLEDVTSSYEWAKEIVDEDNKQNREWLAEAGQRDPKYLEELETFEDKKVEALYHERDVKKLIDEVANLKRKLLDTTRLYDERGNQIERLERGMEFCKTDQWVKGPGSDKED